MKAAKAILVLLTLVLTVPGSFAGLSTDWHPDPDGDGIIKPFDICPGVYDPQQTDADGDGFGDLCDPDFAPPVEDGPITDLRIEHVTPFGAWFRFASTRDAEWGWDAAIAWSTDPNELATFTGFSAAYDRGDFIEVDVFEPFGETIVSPAILIDLEPGTTYYAAATQILWNGLEDAVSDIVEFETQPAPDLTLAGARPRVMTTAEHVGILQNRRASADTGWTEWEAIMRPRIHQAAVDPDDVYLARHYCDTAALLYLVAGQPQDLADALALLEQNIAYWEDHELDGNHYRWEDCHLAVCADLLWSHLDTATKERAVEAFLEDDEFHIADALPRLADTDEFASTTRNWIVSGLTACDAVDIDPDLAARGCIVLEEGLKLWHGVQLVKARRDRGFWAQSGGFLPDGSDYGQGSSRYWLHPFLTLAHNGQSPAPYTRFIRNNLISMVLQLLTPSRLGFATAGDVEDFSYNFSVEPNSFQLEIADSGLLLLAAGALDAAASPAASWGRFLANDIYEDEDSADGLYRLLFESDSLPYVDHRSELGLTHLDSGLGILFDRTSWSENASYLFARAGWSGVDHSHGDIGHFQLYRRGLWVTHEAVGYDGTASQGLGHNVLLMQVPDEGLPTEPRQHSYTEGENRMIRVSGGQHHTAFVADLTAAYRPYRENERFYETVQRALVWIKSDEAGAPDVIVIRDIDRRTPSAPENLEAIWQLHLDDEPTITGDHAEVVLPGPVADQRVTVDLLQPIDTVFTVTPPEGPPDDYPAEVYTYRLLAEKTASTVDRVFFAVVQADEASDSPMPVSPAQSSSFDGALIGDDLVLVATSPVDEYEEGETVLNIEIQSDQALRVFVLGMARDIGFSVIATQNGSTLAIAASPGGTIFSDDGGLLAFEIDASRTVTPLYTGQVVFTDNFETADLSRWSNAVGSPGKNSESTSFVILAHADANLYKGKSCGRNQVVCG